MHGRIPADPQTAIFPAARLCDEKTITAQLCSDPGKEGWFKDFARALWPKKTAASLQFLTGCKERASHYWAAGREPPASIIVSLLRGSDGERVLDQLMRGCKEPWWLTHRRAVAASKAYDAAAQEQLALNLD
jgi:hypothetical protein